MKKSYYLFGIIALVALIAMPVILKAEIDDTATRTPLRMIPAKIRQELRTDIQVRQDNAKLNQNMRNNLLGSRASTTRMMLGSSTRMLGSTTREMGERGGEFFEMRKHNIVRELDKALANLHNIRNRIQARLDKIAADMTEPRRLLVIADAKILAAENAVKLVGALSATSTSKNLISPTSSTTIDLNRPRLIAGGAQAALREAQKALNDVVMAIAHAMGIKLGENDRGASSTNN